MNDILYCVPGKGRAKPRQPGSPVQPSAIAGRVRPLDLIKSSVSQVLAAVQSQTAAGKCARHRAEIRREADGAGGAENFSDARRQMIDATPAP